MGHLNAPTSWAYEEVHRRKLADSINNAHRELSRAFELVQSVTPAADSLFEFYHNGIDNSGTEFLDGWQYLVWMNDVYGSAEATVLCQLYEAGAYRAGAGTDDYLYHGGVFNSASATTHLSTGTAQADLFIGVAGNAVNFGINGILELSNLGSSSMQTWGLSRTNCRDYGASSALVGYDHFLQTDGGNLSRAATKFKIYLSGGATMTAGKISFYRRKAS